MASFQFSRIVDGQKNDSASLVEMLGDDVANQTWLFVTPHDDDLCIGAGLLMQAAVQAGVRVEVLAVTDGSMGYCSLEQEGDIVTIRKEEMFNSFAMLGIPDKQISILGYPDCGLTAYQGRRPTRNEPYDLKGYIGLQNAFTYHLRRLNPARVLLPTATDLHPDHRMTHSELMISLFHASGDIWPELGAPLATIPSVTEMAVYCDFAEPPNWRIVGDADAMQAKLASVEAYQSQAQIKQLVENVRQSGNYEYFHDVQFKLYSPGVYHSLFE